MVLTNTETVSPQSMIPRYSMSITVGYSFWRSFTELAIVYAQFSKMAFARLLLSLSTTVQYCMGTCRDDIGGQVLSLSAAPVSAVLRGDT